MTFVVGLTGGIGAGKSAVADRFSALGVDIIDTDVIAHALTAPGGLAIDDIRAHFGDAYVAADGSLERERMRALVFSDPQAKLALEAMLHPRIRAQVETRVAGSTARYAMVVVPLLVESRNYRNRGWRIAVVDCREQTQVARVMARSGLARSEVLRIMTNQVSRAMRLETADDVIDNDGPIDRLAPQIERLHAIYLSGAAG